nr:hypothetical protein KK1_012020 [Cajanus cajan]
MQRGSWMLFDHYLIVKRWSSKFMTSKAKEDKTLVWVHFPRLGMVFYDESVLLITTLMIGRSVKVILIPLI